MIDMSNVFTHEFEELDPIRYGYIVAIPTVLCSENGVMKMRAVTHQCKRCGFQTRLDHMLTSDYPDCNTLVCESVLQT